MAELGMKDQRDLEAVATTDNVLDPPPQDDHCPIQLWWLMKQVKKMCLVPFLLLLLHLRLPTVRKQ